jgi:D-galactarolactone cycloisomerase
LTFSLKITAVETIHLRHQLARPVGPASVFNTSRQTILVRISTNAGLFGWGEAYALAGVRGAIQDVLAPLLVAVKLKIGKCAPDEELRVLERLRPALPDVKLMVDVWGAYSQPTAMMVGRELERIGVYWYEEPLPQAGYVGYEQLTAALDIAVAGGEMLQSRQSFKELFDRHAVDIVQPDASICGGIGEVLFVADLARLYGIQCVPHTWDGAIMNVATLHVAAALPDATRLPGVDPPLLEFDTTDNPFMTDELVDQLQLVDGCFTVPTAPGLGVEVDEARLQRYIVA